MTRIKAVKQKAILDVAESLGYSFRRLSGQIFEHPDHDSFRIFADTNTFKWFSRDIQGDVIDFVQLVAGVTFKEAVSYLETGDFEQAKVIEETYQPFYYYLREEPFQQALIGKSPYHIAKDLTEQVIPSPSGKSHWNATTIKRMLRNEKYKGDALLQKTYTTDFLTKKKNINRGELPQYYVENNHEAIVDRETFDAVQQVLENKGRKSSTTIFSSKLVCGDCGHFFGSKVWHSTSKYRRVIYQCNEKYKGISKCSTPHVTEEEVIQWFISAVNQVLDNRIEVIDNLYVLLSIGNLEVIDEQIKVLETEAEVVSQLVANLVSENAIIRQDQDKYLKKYNQLTSKYEGIVQDIESLELQRMQKSKRNKELQDFIGTLEKLGKVLTDFDELLWESLSIMLFMGKNTAVN